MRENGISWISNKQDTLVYHSSSDAHFFWEVGLPNPHLISKDAFSDKSCVFELLVKVSVQVSV